MSLFAIGLLLAAAVLHTTWNLLLKQAGEKYIATWWSAIIGFLVFTPAIYFIGFPSQSVWHILVISALFEIAYYIVLAEAYKDLDFSLIYPIGTRRGPGADRSVGRDLSRRTIYSRRRDRNHCHYHRSIDRQWKRPFSNS